MTGENEAGEISRRGLHMGQGDTSREDKGHDFEWQERGQQEAREIEQGDKGKQQCKAWGEAVTVKAETWKRKRFSLYRTISLENEEEK
jgi:hypothetical protein